MSFKDILIYIALGLFIVTSAFALLLQWQAHRTISGIHGDLGKMTIEHNKPKPTGAETITSAFSERERETMRKTLLAQTAHRAEAAYTRTVDIIFLQSSPQRDRRATIELDIGPDWTGGAVLLPDYPADIAIAPGATPLNAAFAVETPFAFRVLNAPNKVLAGFRVGDFGVDDVMLAERYVQLARDKHDTYKVCNFIETWADFFRVPNNKVRVWRVVDPATLALIKPHSIKTDRGIGSRKIPKKCLDD